MESKTSYSENNKLPAEIYEYTRDAFKLFIHTQSVHRDFWESLLEKAKPIKELPDGEFIASNLVILENKSRVVEVIKSGKVKTQAHYLNKKLIFTVTNPEEELWLFSETLSRDAKLALDVLLRRALFPFDALITYPLETLFTNEEIFWLSQQSRTNHKVSSKFLAWQSGQNIDYTGYICTIVKFTRLCNLRCNYCHDWRTGSHQTMPFPVQANLIQKLLQPNNHNIIDVVWHGGEPTLIGKRGFLRILMLQRWFCRSGQKISNLLQTNATTLDPDWIQLLSRYRFRVSLSLDGPAEVHNLTRLYANGENTFADVSRGLQLLRQANLISGALLVVSSALRKIGATTVIQFLQAEKLTEVGVLPLRPDNDSPSDNQNYLTRKDYFQFLYELHCARLLYSTPWIHIREIDTLRRALQGHIAGHCEMLGNCIGHFFAIEPSGEVSHCDKFLGDPEYMLGNILNQDFSQIARSSQTLNLIASNQSEISNLQDCPYFKYCRGWCPHERFLARRYEPETKSDCCGLRDLFDSLKREDDVPLSMG